jgi:dihydropyrimidinase
MHAENGSAIDVIVQQALAEGKTAPIYHALTRPTKAEAEAVHRAIAMAEMAGAPVYIVHLSSEDALNQVREARDRGCRRLPRRVRSICCSRSKTTWTARV